jgi:3-phenylpropionate/cinnamic acid dioxygenase small subunit
MSQDHDRECERFLYREAELLDGRNLAQWLDMLSPSIEYQAPVRTTRSSGEGDGFSKTAFFFDEDYGSLNLRVARLTSEFAWSENPPTRTRRLVTNFRVDATNAANPTLTVRSNFAVYCFRGDEPAPKVLTGERQDLLVREEGSWKLRKRLVLFDMTVLGMDSLSILL